MYEMVVLPAENRDPAEFPMFIGYIVKKLSERDAAKETPIDDVRMFVIIS